MAVDKNPHKAISGGLTPLVLDKSMSAIIHHHVFTGSTGREAEGVSLAGRLVWPVSVSCLHSIL